VKPVCETADTLRRAAIYQRQVASIRRVSLPWEGPLADWLDEAATGADRVFTATQSPSAGVDQPPGVAYGDPAKADRLAAEHYANALRVARAILNMPDPPHTIQTIEGLL
jgi:hypothetical protein